MKGKFGTLSVLLLVLSGLLWGIYGIYGINIVESVINQEWIVRVIYVIFGAAFIYHAISCKSDRKKRSTKR